MFSTKLSRGLSACLVLAANSYCLTMLASLTERAPIAEAFSGEMVAEVHEARTDIQRRAIGIDFVNEDMQPVHRAHVELRTIPNLVTVKDTKNGIAVGINEAALLSHIDTWINTEKYFPKAIVGVVKQHDEWNTTVLKEPREGYTMDTAAFVEDFLYAIEHDRPYFRVTLTRHEPTIALLGSDQSMNTLTRLSQGRSSYEGSVPRRAANVERALNVYLNGHVVPQDSAFSFNDRFAGSTGWSPAYVIGNGGELVEEPGGGICQTSTTLYRAAALAGLPILKRQNHSLYVTYYEEYGVGMDATIYPGKQDFQFKNDTAGPLVILARNEGTDAYVDLYGINDNREVSLNGPIFQNDSNTLKKNEIAWERSVRFADGSNTNETFVSRYLAIPKRLREGN